VEEEEGGMTVDEVTSTVENISIARSEDIDKMHAFLRKVRRGKKESTGDRKKFNKKRRR